MKKLIYNKVKIKSIRKLKDESRHETSLMVSKSYLKIIKSLAKKHQGFSKFLSHLVKNYDRLLKINKHMGGKVLTEYQKKGLDLKKINFMPVNKDWISLKNIAQHYGISISLLFSVLLKNFLNDQNLIENENRRVPVLKLEIFRELLSENNLIHKYLQNSILRI